MVNKLLESINKWLELIYKKGASLKNIREMQLKYIGYSFMVIAYTIVFIKNLGFWVGLFLSLAISFFILSYLKQISHDHEKKDMNIFTLTKSIKYTLILILIFIIYINFKDYYVNPEITITSPKSGELIELDKDNTFYRISGNSKGLANNQFFHLAVLYRRVDSNKKYGEWGYQSAFYNPCTIYNDGSWECQIQLQWPYAEWINETLVVKSHNNSSNNISTNVDIVALIVRQPIGHSISTKFKTSVNAVNELFSPVWAKPGLFFLKLGEGTFYDEYYELDFESYDSDFENYNSDTILYLNGYTLPKHLADSHVTITPVIVESYNLTGNPYGLWVYLDFYPLYPIPASIPADNVTSAKVKVQVFDKEYNWLPSEGIIVNLTSTKGNLSATQITTDSQGSGEVYITSEELGLGLISAQSPGLHVEYYRDNKIMFYLPHVVMEFNQWINSSLKDGETSELIANFQTKHDGEYDITLTACGTEVHWPFKSEDWPKVRVEVDEIVLEDIEINSESIMEFPLGNVLLTKGNHTLKINMTNALEIPLIGSRNLYIERVEFGSSMFCEGTTCYYH